MDSKNKTSLRSKAHPFSIRIAWWQILLLLTVFSFGYFSFMILSRSNFSASDVTLSIQGPDTFKAQERVEFELHVMNKSKFYLGGSLYVILPEFLAFENSQTNEQRIDMARIGEGSEFTQKIQLFARETQKQGNIKVRAEYVPEGLNSRFEGFANVHITVSSLPLTVIFDIPEKAVDGQVLRGSFHFVVEKSLEALPLIARMMLPEDFILTDAEPKPKNTTTWEFQDVEIGKSYRVDFEGTIKGYENEAQKFDLLFGIIEGDLGFTEQYRVSRELVIASAPIKFEQLVNGSKGSIASGGERLKFHIGYENKGGVSIEDVSITVQLEGELFDWSALDAGFGYVNESIKTLVWNKEFFKQLAVLDKDENGSVEFSIALKKDLAQKDYKGKNILLKSKAVIDSSKVPLALKGLSVRSQDVIEVRVRTSIGLSGNAYYYEGPFSNSGPIPPRVDEKTSYTVVWKASNTLNGVKDVIGQAPLPQYISFDQRVYPSGSNLVYNSQTHSILWNIGTLKPGIGSVLPAATVTFGISLIPTQSMRGFPAELIQQGKLTGTDTVTNELIEYESPVLDTTLPEDEGMREGDGVVQ